MIPYQIKYVDPDIADSDEMGYTGRKHYFSVGSSALTIMLSVLALAGMDSPKTILDFGCGAGRVTRWLRAAFPQATISASDLREDDLEFVRDKFGANTWVAGTDPDSMQQPFPFDLIWVGSVITHREAEQTEKLMAKLFEWLKPGGLLVASFHGRQAIIIGNTRQLDYIVWNLWEKIVAGYYSNGYGYSDYPGQKDYGISLISHEWMLRFVNRIEDSRIVLLGEALWDSHHDIIALRKGLSGLMVKSRGSRCIEQVSSRV